MDDGKIVLTKLYGGKSKEYRQRQKQTVYSIYVTCLMDLRRNKMELVLTKTVFYVFSCSSSSSGSSFTFIRCGGRYTAVFFFVFMAAAVIVIEFLHVKVSKFTFCVMCSVKFSSQKLLYKTAVNRRCHI